MVVVNGVSYKVVPPKRGEWEVAEATPEPHEFECPICGHWEQTCWWLDRKQGIWFGTFNCDRCHHRVEWGVAEDQAVLVEPPWI